MARIRRRRARWLRQFVVAVRTNLADPQLVELARRAGSPAQKALAAALHVRRTLPYRFDRSPILSLRAAQKRGFGACGDGTAAVAAVVILAGGVPTLCYEEIGPSDPHYAHVRLIADGVGADAYPDASWNVNACSVRRDVRELVGWRAAAQRARG
jgi:hypothetical protein